MMNVTDIMYLKGLKRYLFCSSLHCCHLLQLPPAFSWVLRVVLHLINSPNPNTISGTIVQPAPSCILPAPWKSRREIQTNWNKTFMLLLSPTAVIEVSASQGYICSFGKAHRSTFQRLWNVLAHDIRAQVKQCMNRTYIHLRAIWRWLSQMRRSVLWSKRGGSNPVTHSHHCLAHRALSVRVSVRAHYCIVHHGACAPVCCTGYSIIRAQKLPRPGSSNLLCIYYPIISINITIPRNSLHWDYNTSAKCCQVSLNCWTPISERSDEQWRCSRLHPACPIYCYQHHHCHCYRPHLAILSLCSMQLMAWSKLPRRRWMSPSSP